MKITDILSRCDHTLLSPTATEAQILATVDEGIEYGTASVCIPPSFVRAAAKHAAGRVKICTVIGFPLGYSHTVVKAEEAKRAILDGADEIDMVINLGYIKDGRYNLAREEIAAIKAVCGDKILKVIIECCLLTDDEKIAACKAVAEGGADFVKTSTGFSTGGATFDDIKLFAKHVAPTLKIKAAGGIKNFEDAKEFLSLGADRLGTSRLVSILKQEKCNIY